MVYRHKVEIRKWPMVFRKRSSMEPRGASSVTLEKKRVIKMVISGREAEEEEGHNVKFHLTTE